MTKPFRLIAIAAVLVLALAFPAMYHASAQEPPLAAEPPNPFAGKVLMISSKPYPDMGATLEDVALVELGGRHFLVGTHVATGHPDEWRVGRRVWLPLDDVLQMVEFENANEVRSLPQGDL